MVHACACCPLRFPTNGELADHVREAHEEHPPFEEGRVTVTRRRFPASGPFQQPRPRTTGPRTGS